MGQTITPYDDPKENWESLKKVNCTCGFATCLALHCHSFFQLKTAAITVINGDTIFVYLSYMWR